MNISSTVAPFVERYLSYSGKANALSLRPKNRKKDRGRVMFAWSTNESRRVAGLKTAVGTAVLRRRWRRRPTRRRADGPLRGPPTRVPLSAAGRVADGEDHARRDVHAARRRGATNGLDRGMWADIASVRFPRERTTGLGASFLRRCVMTSESDPSRSIWCSGSGTNMRSSRTCVSHRHKRNAFGVLMDPRAVLTVLVDTGTLQRTPDGHFVRRLSAM